MTCLLFEKYDSALSTLKFRLFQALFDFIGILITFLALILVYTSIEPNNRYLTCDMSDISFPYLPDKIGLFIVGIYGTFAPILIIILVELNNAKLLPFQNNDRARTKRIRIFFIIFFHSLSLFIFGMGIQLFLTEIGKRWSGRLRPHFLAVCNPINIFDNCTLSNLFKTFDTSGNFCTGHNKDLIKEARLSFPSGHASFSTYTMLFLVIYLEARLVTNLKFRALKPLIQVSAITWAWVTCLKRIVGYYHHGSDVIVGAFLGAVIAIIFTCNLGRVLWEFDKKKRITDFDLLNQDQAL